MISEDEFYKRIGVNVKRLREGVNLTQDKLSEKAGISLDYLGKIEVNINKPGLKTILKLANAMNVKPHEILYMD